jgi:surface antigen
MLAQLLETKANDLLQYQAAALKAANGIGEHFKGSAISGVFAAARDAIQKNHTAMHDAVTSYAAALQNTAITYQAADEALGRAMLALTGGAAVTLGSGVKITVDNPAGIPPVVVGQQMPRNSDAFLSAGGNPFARGQCTWYAWGRVKEITKKNIRFSADSGRHAKNWPDLAINAVKRAIPQRGFVMVDTNGTYGHVAVVESVERLPNGDYKILFSESNWDNNIYSENLATDGKVKEILLSQIASRGFDTFLEIT